MAAPRPRQWAWFLALWTGSVLALGVVAGLLRLVLHQA